MFVTFFCKGIGPANTSGMMDLFLPQRKADFQSVLRFPLKQEAKLCLKEQNFHYELKSILLTTNISDFCQDFPRIRMMSLYIQKLLRRN
jgi:hypothetical protein